MTWQEKILEKIKIIKCLKRERGSILVLTAVLLPILFGCLGIAYDVGNIYIHKARLQNVTDAAALAGGRAYLQSQKKTTGTKDTYDNYTNGNITDEEYVIGGSKTRSGYHPDADNAADVYIYNNIINLGNKVYSDKFSHYALPGYKKVGEDYVNADEIFYRIGLYEKVPLYFLSVITNKNVETVRAGSVVVVKQGTTTGDGEGTPTHPSIFDNLFTYSDFLSVEPIYQHEGNGGAEITAAYQGSIVFTYGNSAESYYVSAGQNGGANNINNHYFETKNDGNRINNTADPMFDKINDPIIDTFFKTTDYVQAFTNKLNSPHIEWDESNNLNLAVADFSPVTLNVNGQNYVRDNTCKNNNLFYAIQGSNSETNEILYKYVAGSNSSQYIVCCTKFQKDQNNFMMCGKKVDELELPRYYMIDKMGNVIEDCYVTIQDNTEMWTNYDSHQNDIQKMDQNTFNNATKGHLDGVTYNVFHVHNKQNKVSSITVKVNDSMPGDENTPIYIIIEKDVNSTVKIEGSDNNIPVIIVYLGKATMTLDLGNGVFKGTIYAPEASIPIQNYNGTFYGNIIAKSITSTGTNKGTWIQKNYLENYEYNDDGTIKSTIYEDSDIKNITNSIEQSIIEANNALTDEIKADIASAFGVDSFEQLGDMDAYQKKTYAEKQQFYSIWKGLYNKYKDNKIIRDILWPWNEHFNIGGTNETLRLINYRTEYQPKENMEDGYVLDPYIYETLGKPNSY